MDNDVKAFTLPNDSSDVTVGVIVFQYTLVLYPQHESHPLQLAIMIISEQGFRALNAIASYFCYIIPIALIPHQKSGYMTHFYCFVIVFYHLFTVTAEK